MELRVIFLTSCWSIYIFCRICIIEIICTFLHNLIWQLIKLNIIYMTTEMFTDSAFLFRNWCTTDQSQEEFLLINCTPQLDVVLYPLMKISIIKALCRRLLWNLGKEGCPSCPLILWKTCWSNRSLAIWATTSWSSVEVPRLLVS